MVPSKLEMLVEAKHPVSLNVVLLKKTKQKNRKKKQEAAGPHVGLRKSFGLGWWRQLHPSKAQCKAEHIPHNSGQEVTGVTMPKMGIESALVLQ